MDYGKILILLGIIAFNIVRILRKQYKHFNTYLVLLASYFLNEILPYNNKKWISISIIFIGLLYSIITIAGKKHLEKKNE